MGGKIKIIVTDYTGNFYSFVKNLICRYNGFFRRKRGRATENTGRQV
jgi:hypothetical protein